MSLPPAGILEIRALYGDPERLVRADGTASTFWEARMTGVEFPRPLPLGWLPAVIARSARVNQAIAEEVRATFFELAGCGAWDHMTTFDGGYCWRPQRGSGKLSMHAYGAALDFNAATNGLGTRGDMDEAVVGVFERRGWQWGGRWSRPDPMHFQWARGA